MISPLPASVGSVPESGVSGYTHSLLTHLPENTEVHAISQKSVNPVVVHPGLEVHRSWEPGIGAASSILSTLRSIDIRLIHLQHEFRLFGGAASTALVVERLRRSLRSSTPIITTLHGVVALSEIDKGFLQRYEIPGNVAFVKSAFRFANRSISFLSSLTIVHHEYFREILVMDYGFKSDSVRVVQPGVIGNVHNENNPKRDDVLRFSRDFTWKVLVFGFLTSYKLPELVVEAAAKMRDKSIHFVFCVSRNPRAESRGYLERYERLKESVLRLGSIASWSEYVPDEDVPSFFDDADLLVLPYVDCISASAVASLAFAHGVRVCFSSPLRPLFPPSDLEFELDVTSLVDAIRRGTIESRAASRASTDLVHWNKSARETVSLWESVTHHWKPS